MKIKCRCILNHARRRQMNNGNPLQFKTVLVVTDLNYPGSSALHYAQAVALLHNSVLVVVHAIDPVSYAFPDGTVGLVSGHKQALDELHRIEGDAVEQNIPIHSATETA